MTRHVLAGLRPEPLGSYLAGLGLFRLLGEQADTAATAAWVDEGLVVDCAVDDMAAWLADSYLPTPVLSPWNGGSGFGIKDREPKRRISDLLAHPSSRLDQVRAAIRIAERLSADEQRCGWDKPRTVREFRNRCPDLLLPWIDATVVLADQQAFFPPLLGTGGNDGRLDFSTNFHERLLELLDMTAGGRSRSLAAARDLLAGTETERLTSAAVGQFDPVLAGGQASSPFGSATSLVNPWEYVLLVEGALLFASGTVRRHQHDAARAARPFTVTFSPDGTVSGALGEESRGEVWVPLWSKPMSLSEVRQVFGEARASWRGRPAQQAVEFYSATRTLGVTRGVDRFMRYGLQQRNGLAFVAVPLERVEVLSRPEVGLAARVEDWVRGVRAADPSLAVRGALRSFDTAHLLYARDGGPLRLRDLLAALTTLELAVGRSGRAREKVPVRIPPRQTSDFLDEFCKRECLELRLAVGIASCAAVERTVAGLRVRSMRHLLLPVDPPDQVHPRGRWRDAPVIGGYGLQPVQDVLADVLAWRSRTAAAEPGSETFRGVPTFRHGVAVPARDLHAFADGKVDEAELDLWLRACLALSWQNVHRHWSRPQFAAIVPTLGLLHPLANGLPDGEDSAAPRLAMRPDWAVKLAAGKVNSVHADAVLRLRQAGWDAVPALPTPAALGPRVAAALVPRCSGWYAILTDHLAVHLNSYQQDSGGPPVADDADVDEQEAIPDELAEELA